MIKYELVEDNIPSIENEVEAAIGRALEMIGLQAEKHAKDALTKQGAVDTGRLRNSVTHQVIMLLDAVAVGTSVEYAPYVEFGTSRGMSPRPYIKPAVENYLNEYKIIIENELRR